MLRRLLTVVALLAIPGASGAQEVVPNAVVRLGADAFPGVPKPVRLALSKRGCRIPQSYGEQKPHNVITGAFTGPKRREWAIICSVRDSSTVLIFSSAGRLVDSMRTEDDESWITRMPEGLVYTQRLDRVPTAALRKLRPDPDGRDPGAPRFVDHDAIRVVMDGKGSTTLYKKGRRWWQVDACC